MAGFMHFTFLHLYISTLLVIYKLSGSLAAKVSINQNITGIIGDKDIKLTCSFTNEPLEKIIRVQFFAKNKTDEFDTTTMIAKCEPDKPAELLSSGNYLNGRVTITNITSMSTNATLTLLVLKCEDEMDYMCKCYYDNKNDFFSETSTPTRISVQVISSKPDTISSFIVLSPKPETTGYNSSLYTTSLSTIQYDLLTFRTSSIDTTTKTHLPLVFHEGDTVIFTCTGNVGNPPGKLVWQKMFPHENKQITYANESTVIENIPGKCSFKGTSYLAVKIHTDDIDAKLRCFKESQVNVPGMYIETKPFNVYFQVNHLDITKQPNQKQYDTKTGNITLTCRGNGNPQPTYTWFKEGEYNTILSNQSFYVIENVIEDNSGVYICEVYNIIEDIRYRKSNSVEINIVFVDELPSPADSSLLTIFLVYVIPVICVTLFIGICVAVIKRYCIRPNGKKKDENYYQTFSHDGITVNSEYASVIHTNNTTARETGDNLGCYNCKEGNKNKSRNNVFGLAVVYDEVDQQVTMKYELSKMGTPGHHDTVNHEVSTGSSKNEGASDRTAVYEEVNQQTTLKYDE